MYTQRSKDYSEISTADGQYYLRKTRRTHSSSVTRSAGEADETPAGGRSDEAQSERVNGRQLRPPVRFPDLDHLRHDLRVYRRNIVVLTSVVNEVLQTPVSRLALTRRWRINDLEVAADQRTAAALPGPADRIVIVVYGARCSCQVRPTTR